MILVQERIEYINNLNAFVISVDISSGIDANNGLILGCAVKGSVTHQNTHISILILLM